jgi:hypothetical protein
MPSAPSSTVDSSGKLQWTNPSVPPVNWNVEACFDDGTPSLVVGEYSTFGSAMTYFDAFGSNWPGGFKVKLWGSDADGNLVYAPTLSSNWTKNI